MKLFKSKAEKSRITASKVIVAQIQEQIDENAINGFLSYTAVCILPEYKDILVSYFESNGYKVIQGINDDLIFKWL